MGLKGAPVAQGIDISKWQKGLALSPGIDFVILRAGYGRETRDPRFDGFYDQAKTLGLMVGAYWYSYDRDPEQAVASARGFLKACKGKNFDLPLFVDLEEGFQLRAGGQFLSQLITAYGAVIEAAGGAAGWYMSTSPAQQVPVEMSQKYVFWAAQYGPACKSRHEVGIWQNSSRWPYGGLLVDHDYAYRDFAWIPKKGLNAF